MTAAAKMSSLLLPNGTVLFVDFALAARVAGKTVTVAVTLRCDCSPVAVIVAMPVCVSVTRAENSPFDAAAVCTAETALCRNANAAGCTTGPPDPSARLGGLKVTEMLTRSPPRNPRPLMMTEPPTLTMPDETVSGGLST